MIAKISTCLLAILDVVTDRVVADCQLDGVLLCPDRGGNGLGAKSVLLPCSSAWIGMLAFFVALVAGIVYLASTRQIQQVGHGWPGRR